MPETAPKNTKTTPQTGGRPAGHVTAPNKPSQAKPLGGGNVSERFTGPNNNQVKDEPGWDLDNGGYKGVDPVYQNSGSPLDAP